MNFEQKPQQPKKLETGNKEKRKLSIKLINIALALLAFTTPLVGTNQGNNNEGAAYASASATTQKQEIVLDTNQISQVEAIIKKNKNNPTKNANTTSLTYTSKQLTQLRGALLNLEPYKEGTNDRLNLNFLLDNGRNDKNTWIDTQLDNEVNTEFGKYLDGFSNGAKQLAQSPSFGRKEIILTTPRVLDYVNRSFRLSTGVGKDYISNQAVRDYAKIRILYDFRKAVSIHDNNIMGYLKAYMQCAESLNNGQCDDNHIQQLMYARNALSKSSGFINAINGSNNGSNMQTQFDKSTKEFWDILKSEINETNTEYNKAVKNIGILVRWPDKDGHLALPATLKRPAGIIFEETTAGDGDDDVSWKTYTELYLALIEQCVKNPGYSDQLGDVIKEYANGEVDGYTRTHQNAYNLYKHMERVKRYNERSNSGAAKIGRGLENMYKEVTKNPNTRTLTKFIGKGAENVKEEVGKKAKELGEKAENNVAKPVKEKIDKLRGLDTLEKPGLNDGDEAYIGYVLASEPFVKALEAIEARRSNSTTPSNAYKIRPRFGFFINNNIGDIKTLLKILDKKRQSYNEGGTVIVDKSELRDYLYKIAKSIVDEVRKYDYNDEDALIEAFDLAIKPYRKDIDILTEKVRRLQAIKDKKNWLNIARHVAFDTITIYHPNPDASRIIYKIIREILGFTILRPFTLVIRLLSSGVLGIAGAAGAVSINVFLRVSRINIAIPGKVIIYILKTPFELISSPTIILWNWIRIVDRVKNLSSRNPNQSRKKMQKKISFFGALKRRGGYLWKELREVFK